MFLKIRDRLKKTPGLKLAIWYSLGLMFSFLVLLSVVYGWLFLSLKSEDREMTLNRIEIYSSIARTRGLKGLLSHLNEEEADGRLAGMFVHVQSSQGVTRFLICPKAWEDLNPANLKDRKLKGNYHWYFIKAENEEDVMEIASSNLTDGISLQVGQSTHIRYEQLERFGAIFVILFIPLALFSLSLGTYLALIRSHRPVRELIQTARMIKDGQLSARVPHSGSGDELDDLAVLFNDMLDRIEELLNGMHDTVDNVAHDLRTPLTRMKASLETAMREEIGLNDIRERLFDCTEELEKISTLLSALMDITEAETGLMKLQLIEINIASLVAEVLEIYEIIAEEKDISITADIPETLKVHADIIRLRQSLGNLLDNAIKYTPRQGQVNINARTDSSRVFISVADNGPGIAIKDQPHVFNRLYRGDKSRSQPGLGLGLSIVQAFIQAHKGSLKMESKPGQGSTFTIVLPSNPAQH